MARSADSRWKSGNYRGGRVLETDHKGRHYVLILIYPDDPYYSMASGWSKPSGNAGKYIREHRLVMARYLGRCLHPWEIVHHINGIRHDNRIENLSLETRASHLGLGILNSKVNCLQNKVDLLQKEVKFLRYVLKENGIQLQKASHGIK